MLKYTCIIFIVSYSLCVCGCGGAEPVQPKPIPDMSFTSFRTNDSGLIGDKILSLFVEQNGSFSEKNWKLWIGTTKGLNTFNGTNWEVYNTDNSGLKSNIIHCIYKDHKDRLWAGTEYGISCYKQGKWMTLDIGRVLSICVSRENDISYFGTSSGIYELHGELSGKNLIHHNRNNSGLAAKELSSETEKIYSIAQDNKGDFWFGTGDGLIKLRQKHWQIFFGAHKKVSMFGSINEEAGNCPLLGNRIRAIAQDDSGNLWLGSNGGVNVFDPSTGVWKHAFSADRKVSSNIDGKYSVKILKGNSKLIGAWVHDIVISETDVWIATTSGLSKYSHGKWNSFTTSNGLCSNRLSCIAVAGNNIFVGTENGLTWMH